MATTAERILIQWDTNSLSMVEVEVFSAALKKDVTEELIHFTLSIEGERIPKLSELNRLLQLLEPLIQREGTFYIYCESAETKKLLKFCGFSFIATLIEEHPGASKDKLRTR